MSTQDQIQQSDAWDSLAAQYDEANATTADAIAVQALGILGVTPGQNVLDVAAGPGYFSLRAAEVGAKVLAIDFSQGMVDHLRDKVQRLGIGGLRVEVMNGQDLKLEDNSFDIAYSSLGIMLFPDRAAGMREFYRVLKPGGMGAIVALTGLEDHGIQSQVMSALNKVMPDFERAGSDPRFSLANPDIFRAEMMSAGFSRVNMFTVRIVEPFDSPEVLWKRIGHSPVVSRLANNLTESQIQTLGDNFVEQIRSTQGDGPYGMKYQVRIAVGVK